MNNNDDLNSQAAKVVEAVRILHFSQESSKKREANHWLQDFQTTVSAWKIIDMILCDSDAAMELQFFAAQTMRKKIISDLGQLPNESIPSLRESLLNQIYSHRKSKRSLLTQLILAISDLAVQMHEWEDPIQDLENAFGASEETIPLLLEFMKALPEECLNSRIPLDIQVIESRTKKLVDSKVCHVLDMIISYFGAQGMNAPHAPALISCLQSWMKNCRFDDPSYLNNRMIIVTLLFQATQVPALFDEAVEAICDLFYATRNSADYLDLIMEIYKGLEVMLGLVAKLIEDECDEDIRSVCRIFVEAGESYIEFIIRDLPKFRVILEGIIRCSSYRNLEIAQLTFHFWWSLAERLTEEPGLEFSPDPAFADIFLELVKITVSHLRYPEDSSQTAQEKEDFRSFRHEIGDCLKYCCKVIGESRPLMFVLNCLQSYQLNLTQRGSTSWQEIESCLFALRAMGSNVNPMESQILPEIMKILPSLPGHPKIKYATVLVYSRYAEWTLNHLEYLESQLKFIVSGFEESEIRAASALALKFVCQFCGPHLSQHVEGVYNLFLRSIKEFHYLDTLEIIESSCCLMNTIQDSSVCMNWCTLYLEAIGNEFKRPTESFTSADDIVKHLHVNFERLGTLLKFFQPCCAIPDNGNPVIKFMIMYWDSVFVLNCTQYGYDEKIAESICRSIINCIKLSRDAYISLLPQTLLLMDACFKAHFLSAFLYASQHCVKQFASPKFHEMVEPMVNLVISMTNEMTRRFSFEDVSNASPDVIIDYFYLIETLITNVTESLKIPTFYQNAIHLAVACLDTKYEKSSRSALQFLSILFGENCEWSEGLAAFVTSSLGNILVAVLTGCLRRFERYNLEISCNIIIASYRRYPRETLQNVETYVRNLPDDRFSISEKSIHGSKLLEQVF